MWRQAETTGRGRRCAGAVALGAALLAALLFPWPADLARAAEVTAGDPAAATDREALAERIDQRYRVLPTRQGLLLEPREEVPGIQTIEIAGGEVAINGEPVAPTILRSWLGDEATPLLGLAALPEDEARALFAAQQAAAPPVEEGAESEELEADAEVLDDPAELAAVEEEDEEEDRKTYLGERVIFGQALTLEEDQVASEVVVIGGAVHVRGRVDGGVVAIGGPVIIEGRVRGDLVAIGGGIELGPDGSVGGDVVSVGSQVRAREGQIRGDVVQISLPWVWDGGGWDRQWGSRGSPVRAWAAREAVANVAVILLLGLMTAFLLLVARGPVERAAQVITRHPGSAVASGVAMWIFQLVGIWLAFLLVVIFTVGLGCILLPLLPVLWLFGWLLYLPGYAAVALAVGRALTGRFGWNLRGAYGPAIAGVLAIELVKLLGNVLAIGGGALTVMAMLIKLTGLLIVLLAWTTGVGAIVMNLLNRRRPTPPPLPPGPLPEAPAGGPGAPPPAPTGDASAIAAPATAPPPGEPPAAPSHPAAPPHPAAPAPEPPPPEPPAGEVPPEDSPPGKPKVE